MEAILPRLSTARLRLRQLESSDLPALYRVFSDPRVTRYWSAPPFPDLQAAQQYLDEIDQHRRAGTLLQWGIAEIDSDRVMGTVTLFRWDRQHRRAEIGFAMAADDWGRGYATEAVGRLIEHGFGELELNRWEADVDPRNAASLRVLAKLGFQREGYSRQRFLVGDEWQDSVILGLLRQNRSSSALA